MATSKRAERAPQGDASVLKRVAGILDLLTEDHPALAMEEVGSQLGVSDATAYRYLADLCEMGLLHRVRGAYAPGPKVLELDYLIRKFDPILQVSRSMMQELSAKTGCHVLLSKLYGDSLVNVFYAKVADLPDIPFIPGRRLPVFRGSQSRAVLAYIDRRRLRRIFEAHAYDPARAKLGENWSEFSATNALVRKTGYYISRDELAPDTTGIAAPVLDENGDPIGALALTFASSMPPWMGESLVAQLTVQYAAEISKLVSGTAASSSLEPG